MQTMHAIYGTMCECCCATSGAVLVSNGSLILKCIHDYIHTNYAIYVTV